MANGLSAVNLANAWLNVLRGGGNGVTFTAPATIFSQIHTSAGDPGSAGTANVSSTTTRQATAFGAASAGSMAATTLPSWTSWAGTSPETVAHLSLWSASTSGTFYASVALTASKTVQTGDSLSVTSLSISLAPLAA